jgi:hypothetical protein
MSIEYELKHNTMLLQVARGNFSLVLPLILSFEVFTRCPDTSVVVEKTMLRPYPSK